MPEESAETQAGAVSTATVPQAKYVPKPEKTPAYKPPVENFADNEETVEKALAWTKSFESQFEEQDQWEKFDEEMDIADEMFRAAANRSQLQSDQSSQVQATGSKIKSATFFADHRAITSWENTIICGNEEELPMVYEPLPNTPKIGEVSAKAACDYNNIILEYTFNVADLRAKIRKTLWTVNKYANTVVEMIWDYRREERTIKKPKTFKTIKMGDQDIPIPKTYSYEKKVVTIADNPQFIIHDMKDVRFDAMIEDTQAQSYLRFRMQLQLSDIWALQRANEYKNAEKITVAQLYQGENDDRNVKTDRQVNAGEAGDANKPTNLFDVNRGYIRIPVDYETGEWNEKKYIPRWFEFAWVGDLNSNAVCVKLSPLRWTCGMIPAEIIHSHEDDKGGLHLGNSTLCKSLIAQEMTCVDQCIDNVNTRNRVPLIAERGSLSLRNKVFTEGGNAIWWKTPGAQDPHELRIEDTTMITLNMLANIDERRRKVLGTTKPFMGEALGSRTSASEYLGVADQALKPALDDAKYKAGQLLYFIAFWCKEMWSDVGDPELKVRLTYQGKDVEVMPSGMFRDVGIRIVAIKRFQDSILRQKAENDFNATMLPMLLQYRAMPVKGLIKYSSSTMKARGFDGVDGYFGTGSDQDAINVATAENMNILWNGVYDLPQPGENDEVHLAQHKPYYATVSLAPEDARPPEKSMNMMAMHIKMHENQMAQASQVQAQGQTGAPARTNGEAAGDMLGAMGGSEANSMRNVPTEGRPPMNQGQDLGEMVTE